MATAFNQGLGATVDIYIVRIYLRDKKRVSSLEMSKLSAYKGISLSRPKTRWRRTHA